MGQFARDEDGLSERRRQPQLKSFGSRNLRHDGRPLGICELIADSERLGLGFVAFPRKTPRRLPDGKTPRK